MRTGTSMMLMDWVKGAPEENRQKPSGWRRRGPKGFQHPAPRSLWVQVFVLPIPMWRSRVRLLPVRQVHGRFSQCGHLPVRTPTMADTPHGLPEFPVVTEVTALSLYRQSV